MTLDALKGFNVPLTGKTSTATQVAVKVPKEENQTLRPGPSRPGDKVGTRSSSCGMRRRGLDLGKTATQNLGRTTRPKGGE